LLSLLPGSPSLRLTPAALGVRPTRVRAGAAQDLGWRGARCPSALRL